MYLFDLDWREKPKEWIQYILQHGNRYDVCYKEPQTYDDLSKYTLGACGINVQKISDLHIKIVMKPVCKLIFPRVVKSGLARYYTISDMKTKTLLISNTLAKFVAISENNTFETEPFDIEIV